MTSPVVPTGYGYGRVFPTRWNDNDVYGHVNNTIHYAAMDTTITSWLIEIAGLQTGGEHALAVVVSSGCTYRESVSFPDILVIGLRAGRIGSTSVTWDLGIYTRATGCSWPPDSSFTSSSGRSHDVRCRYRMPCERRSSTPLWSPHE